MRVGSIASFAVASLLAGCGQSQETLVEPTASDITNAIGGDASKADAAAGAFKIVPSDAQWLYYGDATGAYLDASAPTADFYFQAKSGVTFKLGEQVLNSASNPMKAHGVSWTLSRAMKNSRGKYVWSPVADDSGKNGSAIESYTTSGTQDGLYLMTVSSSKKPESVTVSLTCSGKSGVCSPKQQPGESCGGFRGGANLCESGLYCSYGLGQSCGYADQTGTCAVTPTYCSFLVGPPFCGCDGNTYRNHCEAARNGVSELHDGACAVDVVGSWEEIASDNAHYDYTFAADGTFTSVMEPGCVYSNPHCEIRLAQSTGTYTVDGTTLSLTYTSTFHTPTTTTFDIGAQLTGVDYGTTDLSLSKL